MLRSGHPSGSCAAEEPLEVRYTAKAPDASVTPEVTGERTFAARAEGVEQELEALRRLMALSQEPR